MAGDERNAGDAGDTSGSLISPPQGTLRHHDEVTTVDERVPTLLVIEDAQDQAVLVSVAARRAHPGLEVHIAGDGQQGIDYLSGISLLKDPPTHATPDIVILDIEMPVVDGFGVLEWIREQFGTPPFPVVVLSGSTNPTYEARARALGATDVYRKPTDLMGLGDTVKKIVTRWIDPRDIMAAHMRFCG